MKWPQAASVTSLHNTLRAIAVSNNLSLHKIKQGPQTPPLTHSFVFNTPLGRQRRFLRMQGSE